MISDEKRAFRRIHYKFTVRFRRHTARDAAWHSSATENLSQGGMYFASLEKYKIGDLLDCAVEAGTAGECSFQARVVRCEALSGHMVPTFGVAVEFVKAQGDADKRLKAIL